MNVSNWNQVLPDIPRLYTALAEWLACLICVLWADRKIRGWKFVVFSAITLAVQSIFLNLTGNLESVMWFLCMGIAVGIMYLYIWSCCEMNWKDSAYYCVDAFVTAEFAASLEWQLDCFFTYTLGWTAQWLKLVWLILVYGLVYLLRGRMYRKYWQDAKELQVTNRELISYVIIGFAVFLVSNLGFISIRTPFSSQYMSEVFNIRTIIDLGGMAILYAYHEQRMELRKEHELERVQNMLHNQYQQYEQAQKVIDLINYKHHDLKHQILALRAEEDAQVRSQYLDKMEEEIKAYEIQYRTGNKVLDTLLTTKGMNCSQNDISMTCVVDGFLFDFIDVMDICSIFGNALDNAIEYEKKVEEKEKRLIHVSACEKHHFLVIHIENYCADTLEFRADLPVTTKEDARFHGYGLKSIQYTVKKYNGQVDVGVQDDWFHVKILIPMRQKEVTGKNIH